MTIKSQKIRAFQELMLFVITVSDNARLSSSAAAYPGGPRANCEGCCAEITAKSCGGELCFDVSLFVLLLCSWGLRPIVRRHRRSLFLPILRAGTWKDKPNWLNIKAASAF